MSRSTEIDRWLRHSRLARVQPIIRAQFPWLHQFLLAARDRVLPFQSTSGLSRYQHRAIERFYSFNPDLSGLVLEVGSDVDGRALKELAARGVKRILGSNIDLDLSQHSTRREPGKGYEIVGADVRRLPLPDESVSAILSITAFEHIHNMDVALEEMFRVLKPGGIMYSDFGPIWSSSIGHHVFAIVDGVEARHWKPGKNPVPHYGHFLLTPEEMRAAVLKHSWVFPKLADAVVDYIYRGPAINRLFYEDYERVFKSSRFNVRSLTPVLEHVPRAIEARLAERFPAYKMFGVRMAEVVLEKPRR